ncbi:hypothetical protein [Acetobacter senegalensis]|uniref:hypothetical protein n=1 Tax=Acetobacter senegalensis TaxID=446692 RepID=UPI00264CC5F2|nr:hypothetical protein [Acetobacter senegalensis]MDN7350004.1 hypothetical protein [Acetobacter senegalensis]
MQEFQKLITPGHITGHRAKAALAPFYAPACVSYTAGIVLALCAFTGVGGHALTMPAWFDRAFTADVAVYQKAADARAAAAQKAAFDKAEAERKAAESKAQSSSAPTIPQTTNAAPQTAPVVASAPQAAPPVPADYSPSPALQEAIQVVGLMPPATTPAEWAQQSAVINDAMTKLINADRAISDRASDGFASCARQEKALNEQSLAAAPDHILRGEAQMKFFDFKRTCISDLLASFVTKE